jgi:chromosome segregation ATPase
MQRVYGLVDEELVHRIDEKAGEQKVSRAQWIRMAIESNLHRTGEQETIEAVNLQAEAVKLREEAVNLRTALEEQSRKIAVKDGELAGKDDDIDRLKQQLKDSASQATHQWEELKSIRSENTKQKKLLEEAQATIQHLKDDLLKRQSETDLLAKAREELAAARMEADKLKESINLRNQDVSFLQGHVAQLTQSISQLSLKPGDEEIKRKGWWQFWK